MARVPLVSGSLIRESNRGRLDVDECNTAAGRDGTYHGDVRLSDCVSSRHQPDCTHPTLVDYNLCEKTQRKW